MIKNSSDLRTPLTLLQNNFKSKNKNLSTILHFVCLNPHRKSFLDKSNQKIQNNVIYCCLIANSNRVSLENIFKSISYMNILSYFYSHSCFGSSWSVTLRISGTILNKMVEATLFVLIASVLLLLWCYIRYSYSYWKRKGVPYLKPTFPFGSFSKGFLQQISIDDQIKEIYESTSEPFIGVYSILRPVLVVRDPELVRTVLIKDFEVYFFYYNTFASILIQLFYIWLLTMWYS